MVEASLWHPVALSGAVQQTPLAVQLLKRDLVLWRADDGAVQAFADQCPHRGARLSLGRVHNNRLECAYHGWPLDPRAEMSIAADKASMAYRRFLKASGTTFGVC